MEYLRTVAKVLEGTCDKNDLLGEQSTEMADGFLGVTRESLGNVFTKKQREPVTELAEAPSNQKDTIYCHCS